MLQEMERRMGSGDNCFEGYRLKNQAGEGGEKNINVYPMIRWLLASTVVLSWGRF